MPLTTVTITGRVALPDNVSPLNAKVKFVLTSFDVDNPDEQTVLQKPVFAEIDASGDISVDLWPNERGQRGTSYNVFVVVRTEDRRDETYSLGSAIVGDADATLDDIIDVSSPVGFTSALEAALAAKASTDITDALAADAVQDRALINANTQGVAALASDVGVVSQAIADEASARAQADTDTATALGDAIEEIAASVVGPVSDLGRTPDMVDSFRKVHLARDGSILWGYTEAGTQYANSLDLGHTRTFTMQGGETSTDWAMALATSDGVVLAGLRQNGEWVGSDFETGAAASSVRWYVEPGQDASSEMVVNWHASEGSTPVLEYRVQGATSWMSARARKTDVQLNWGSVRFSVLLVGLSPAAVYEVRTAGSGDLDTRTFRTLPDDATDTRIVFASDMQVPDEAGDPLSNFNILNDHIRDSEPDLVVLGGDYVSDEGENTNFKGERWRRFLTDICDRFVRDDGSMIPIATMVGNHECTTYYDGDGELGFLDRLFDVPYQTQRDNVGGQGYGWFGVSNEVMVVMLESNHSTPLQPQIQWITELMADRAHLYRHVIVAAHQNPFPSRDHIWDESTGSSQQPAPRLLRNEVIPAIQDYPNVRFVMVGHSHFLMATHTLKVDPANTDANNFYRDTGGLRVLGAGGWGAPAATTVETEDRLSSGHTDGTRNGDTHLEFALSTNGVQIGVTPISTLTNSSTDPATLHFWQVTLGESTINGQAINLNGAAYIDVTETVGA